MGIVGEEDLVGYPFITNKLPSLAPARDAMIMRVPQTRLVLSF